MINTTEECNQILHPSHNGGFPGRLWVELSCFFRSPSPELVDFNSFMIKIIKPNINQCTCIDCDYKHDKLLNLIKLLKMHASSNDWLI